MAFSNYFDKIIRDNEFGLDTTKRYKKPHWGDTLEIRYKFGKWIYYKDGKITNSSASMGVLNGDLYEISEQDNNIKLEDITMAKNVNYIGGEYKIAEATYNLKDVIAVDTYYFKIDADVQVAIDDLLVVESQKGFGLVKLVSLHDDTIANKDKAKQATAWVVNNVDCTRHLAKKEATERREYVLSKLEEKKEQMEAIKMYALLAEMDPEAKLLIEELKLLGV